MLFTLGDKLRNEKDEKTGEIYQTGAFLILEDHFDGLEMENEFQIKPE